MILTVRRAFLPALFLVACTSLQADVTMRMSLHVKVNMALPAGTVPELPFNEVLTRIKGDRGAATMGSFTIITDLARNQITFIDSKKRVCATMPMADYLAKMKQSTLGGATGANGQATPDAAKQGDAAKQADAVKQMMAKVKFDIQSRDTGRTDRIGGIDAFEREVVINMSIPVPVPGQENGMQFMMKLQIWKPQPAEFDRVPALRELAAYSERNLGLNNPVTMLSQIFSSMPGLGDNAGKIVEEVSKGGNVPLGMHMGFFMPGLAKMMEQARAQGASVPDLPAGDKPLAEVNLGLKELSPFAVPDDVFAIPAGYKEGTADDLVKGMLASFTGGKQ